MTLLLYEILSWSSHQSNDTRIHTYIYKTSLVLVDYTNKGKEEAKERARVVDRDCHHIDNPNKSAL